MTDHLQMAKLFLEDEEHGVNTKEEYELAGVTHALIAIAEQLEKMNGNKGLCDKCQFPYQTCTCWEEK